MSFDYIIAGGGSAGCVLASRLSEEPAVKVLLLEAGGTDRHPLFHMPAGFAKMTKGIGSWGWHTVPQRHMGGRALRFTQAKVIGGGSSINAQLYTRGNPLDYEGWANAGNCGGWGYRDLLPYFKRSEDNQRLVNEYHSYGGPLGVSAPVNPPPICDAYIRAAQEAGVPYNADFNGAVQAGAGFYQLTTKNARRSSTASGFLRQALGRANLTVMTGATVTRIAVEKGRAVGVDLVENGAVRTLRAEREVLVTSGAIGSPKLLLQSGIGPADHLGAVGVNVVHDLPGVGGNLQDHLDLFVICECTGEHTFDNYAKPHRAAWAGLQYLLFKTGPVSSSLFETGGFWFADETAPSPDIQFHLGLGSGIEAGVAKLRNTGVTLNSAFLRPRSRGTVRLASANPADAPLIDPNYWDDPYDREMALRGLDLAREIMRQKALKPFVLQEVLPGPVVNRHEDLVQFAWKNAKTDHHPVGTCKMGTDVMAVVGPDLKVHGLEGLRVCDSSIMPTLVSSNTNGPTIMIGERAADLVRGLPPLAPATVNIPDQSRAARPAA